MFRKMFRSWMSFSGMVEVTHCLMSNHFHLLLWVPPPQELELGELLSRLKKVWPDQRVQEWQEAYERAPESRKKAMIQTQQERMGNLPEFMRVLKQGFSRWYNHHHNRSGALWDGRYRSVVVDTNPLALLSVSAYIDLNPLRAGMVKDPVHYPWCGYGAACAGDGEARNGLDGLIRLSRGIAPRCFLQLRRKALKAEGVTWREVAGVLEEEEGMRAAPDSWKEVQSAYRIWLLEKGKAVDASTAAVQAPYRCRKGFSPEQVIAEFERMGHVPLQHLLRARVKGFSRCVALGGQEFLEELFYSHRSCFADSRSKVAKPFASNACGLQVLRQIN